MQTMTAASKVLKVLRIADGVGCNVARLAMDAGISHEEAFAGAEELMALPRTPVRKRETGEQTFYSLAALS